MKIRHLFLAFVFLASAALADPPAVPSPITARGAPSAHWAEVVLYRLDTEAAVVRNLAIEVAPFNEDAAIYCAGYAAGVAASAAAVRSALNPSEFDTELYLPPPPAPPVPVKGSETKP